MEMPDRDGHPWFAIERFIAGKDQYGASFVKHNTNSGFVDLDLHRVTPQVFSAHTFYSSDGTRLVADIQGVGDLFTDPQVLSNDYRFGDGDLGPRGMALFFKSFRHCSFSDSMGIPTFPLSRNELKHQAKYNDEEDTVSEAVSNAVASAVASLDLDDDDASFNSDAVEKALCRFAALDMNRMARQSALHTPMEAMRKAGETNQADDATEKRSNMATTQKSVSAAIRKSMKAVSSTGGKAPKPTWKRDKSDVDEIAKSFDIAIADPVYDHRAFHRLASGALRERSTHTDDSSEADERPQRRKTTMMHTVQPLIPNEKCKHNLGRVHYHLACLHGIGRFPEVVPDDPDGGEKPQHDVYSVVFHLCHAASLRDVPACLALARVRAGLDSSVSDLLKTVVPVDFESAKDLLGRGMESHLSPSASKAAAGCLLLQILEDEGEAGDLAVANVVQDTIDFMAKTVAEEEERAAKRAVDARGGGIEVGDKVEANCCLEGTFYSGVVMALSDDGKTITVQYDDDGSSESLSEENVRVLSGATAGADVAPPPVGGPLTDAEALGTTNDDEICLYEAYTLRAKLAELKLRLGDKEAAAGLYQEAADEAMNAGKMKTAAEWSAKAGDLN
jgi:elongation factor 2 kinase